MSQYPADTGVTTFFISGRSLAYLRPTGAAGQSKSLGMGVLEGYRAS